MGYPTKELDDKNRSYLSQVYKVRVTFGIALFSTDRNLGGR